MHITFLALSPTWWIVGTLVFFVLALIVSLLLIRLYIVDQRVMNTTDKWLRDARAQRDRLNKERDHLLEELRERDEAIERYVKNEADLLRDKTKLSGQVKELQECIKALEDENTRILREYEELEQKYNGKRIDVTSVDTENLYKMISNLTAESEEQLEKMAEQKRTITQQQQIIDDLRKPEPPRKMKPDDWRNIPNTDSPAQEPTKPAPRKKAGT